MKKYEANFLELEYYMCSDKVLQMGVHLTQISNKIPATHRYVQLESWVLNLVLKDCCCVNSVNPIRSFFLTGS